MDGLNKAALFCDETEEYRLPCEAEPGQALRLFFRTERNGVDAVYYINSKKTEKKKLRLYRRDSLFDYYELNLLAGEEPIHYWFEIQKGEEICFYNRLGVVDAGEAEEEYAFCIVPGFHVPDWLKGAVMYQIYVDRFCNGDPSNDVESGEYRYLGKWAERVEDWNEKPNYMDVYRFYGGDLKGVWDKLDYLKNLGVEVIYLNPVFVSPSNHKYDCQDYDYIDPHLTVIKKDYVSGHLDENHFNEMDPEMKYVIRTADKENLEASNEFFARFVAAAHEKGLKVILDGVFNHCGSFHKWMDAERIYQKAGGYPVGAYHSEASPYHKFFKFNKEDDLNSYDGWWGHDTLPKLNYEESPELYRYVMNIGAKWVSEPYRVDGWRLDVAADLGRTGEFNHQFWRDFRASVKRANPNAVILAEHYGDPESWLQGDQWDTIMNYDAFMEPVSWFLTGMEKHSDEDNWSLYGNGRAFFDMMRYHMCKMHYPSLISAMNELSNHDHSRFMTRTNQWIGRLADSGSGAAEEGISYGIFRQGVVIQMTWQGAPTIYYGDETGVCGWTDPDSRRTYPWGREDYELIEFHRYMIQIRKRCPAFRKGSLKELLAGNEIIAYGRFCKGSRCVVIINTGEKKIVRIPVWQIGITDKDTLKRKMMTYEEGYNVGMVIYEVSEGILEIEVPATGSMVLTAEN